MHSGYEFASITCSLDVCTSGGKCLLLVFPMVLTGHVLSSLWIYIIHRWIFIYNIIDCDILSELPGPDSHNIVWQIVHAISIGTIVVWCFENSAPGLVTVMALVYFNTLCIFTFSFVNQSSSTTWMFECKARLSAEYKNMCTDTF